VGNVVRYMVDNGKKKLLSPSLGFRREKAAFFEMSQCGYLTSIMASVYKIR
jgi:hypothetical protein